MHSAVLARIQSKIYTDRQMLVDRVAAMRGKGVRVFTNGCFDILHRGHVDYLCRARDLGDSLIVALNTDESVQRLKGPERPVQTLEDRMFIMASLECVDVVACFDERTPETLLDLLRPEIHVKGGDYVPEDLPEKAVMDSYGGRIVILPFVAGRSTTGIIKKIEGR